GPKLRIVTLSASPGSAPSIWTGPVTGLTLPKSRRAKSSSVALAESCPPEASRVSNSTVSPGATVSFGGNPPFQPRGGWSLWMVWLRPRPRVSLAIAHPQRFVVDRNLDWIDEQFVRSFHPRRVHGEALSVEHRRPRGIGHDADEDLAPCLLAFLGPCRIG